MLPQDLKVKLMAVNSSRQKRHQTARWVTQKPQYLHEMLYWCFNAKSELLVNSAWVLEIICEQNFKAFFKNKQLFFQQFRQIENHSALRACAKICEMLCHSHYKQTKGIFIEVLTENERKIITECSFDWLLTDQKVACQVHAMQCLYFLGADEDKKWIYPELKNILTQNAPIKSAGYKPRARKILKNIL